MNKKAIVLALLALVCQAQAATVSQSQAASAARAWVRSGAVLGARFGQGAKVSAVETVPVRQGIVLHAVRLSNGGTVFVSGDTATEPIVAFTASPVDPAGPLMDILKRDAYLRSVCSGASATAATSSRTAAASSRAAAAEGKWTSLLSAATTATTAADPIREEDVEVISDMRVKPLLETRWSQTEACGKPCYNYYTTNGVPCGCSATAASQILRYHKFPEKLAELSVVTCTVEGVACEMTQIADPNDPKKPKPYDWEKMVAVPANGVTEEQCEAIGHLTYDVAVLLGSYFTSSETGADPNGFAKLFTTLGYPSAYMQWDGNSYASCNRGQLNSNEAVRQRIILANLDAKLPVQLSIYGWAKNSAGKETTNWGGHSVVADGYGFTHVNGSTTTYVHVNLGWAGTDDAWYNLPVVDTASAGATIEDASGYNFKFLGGVAYNISTNEAAKGKDLITGRLTADGAPCANARVTVIAPDGTETEATTDANGIYSAWVEGNLKYDVKAESEDRNLIGWIDAPVYVNHSEADDAGLVGNMFVAGNYWGADFELLEPTVCVGGETYPNLDRALAHATPGTTVEILRPTTLKASFTLPAAGDDYVITATNEDAYATPVTCLNGASLTLTNGVSVSFTNIVFLSSPAAATVKVKAGGRAKVSGVAAFDDLSSGVSGIEVESADGFYLIGRLANGITLKSAVATKSNQAFGSYACADADAADSASRIVSVSGSNRAGKANKGVVEEVGSLVWVDDVEIDPEVAVAKVSRGGNDPIYARSLDTLLSQIVFTSHIELTLLRATASLGRKVPLANCSLKVLSSYPNGTVVTVTERDAGFTVGLQGSLSVSNTVFIGSAAADSTFLLVDGEDATATFAKGAAIRGFTTTQGTKTYGAVAVKNGVLTLAEGASITDCHAAGTSYAIYGGGVYLNGKKATLRLQGGVIANCSATSYGGGVYAYAGSSIYLSGAAKVCDCTSGTTSVKDDIYLASTSCNLIVAGDLEGGEIGVRYADDGNEKGAAFATIQGSASVETASFFNDTDDTLVAARSEAALVWAEASTGPQPLSDDEKDRAGASIKVDGETAYYATPLDALEAFLAKTGDGVVTVMSNATISSDLVITNRALTLCGAEGVTPVLTCALDASVKVVAGGSLSISNLALKGRLTKATENALISVNGGELTLKDGALVADVRGSGNRAAGGIKVWNQGVLTMESGAVISNCWNSYLNVGDDAGFGGGLLVDNATANLMGGLITDCRAQTGGGVGIGNCATLNLSGDIEISGNTNLDGVRNNLCVQESGCVVVAGELSNRIGYTPRLGWEKGTAFCDQVRIADEAAAQASAHCFARDDTLDIGMAVKKSGTAFGENNGLFVWSNDVDADGKIVLGGETLVLAEGNPVKIDVPLAEPNLVYTGSILTGVVEGVGYTLTGSTAINAGNYTATATLKTGFSWTDGSTASEDVDWAIAQASYDLSAFAFRNASFTYDGQEKNIYVSGNLPQGVEVEYVNNGQVNAGEYEVTAKFTVSDPNYLPLDDMVATNTINKAVYDVSHLKFYDVDYAADGVAKNIAIEGALPPGVTVEYKYVGTNETSGVEHVLPDAYEVTAVFKVDEKNYEPIPDMLALMTVYPSSIPVVSSFSISTLTPSSAQEWTLSVGPTDSRMTYTLQSSSDLNSWSDVETRNNATLNGQLQFTVPVDKAQGFWKVISTPNK